MATASDVTHLSEALYNLGKDVHEKQEIIIKKAEEGRKFMNMLKMEIDFKINENSYNETIMNLLHYRQYNLLTQQIFLHWDELGYSYSEQLYINAGKFAKQLHDDFNEELFYITMTNLLFYKANGDENKIDKLYDIYEGLIGREWLDAKMLKSLK